MVDRKKIVMTSSVNISSKNATAMHLLSLAKELAHQNYQIVLIVPEYEGVLTIPLPGKHVTVELTKRLSLPAIPNSLSTFLQLTTLWRYRHNETLYIRTGPLSLVITVAARLFGYRKIILEVNGWIADELKAIGYHWILTSAFAKLQLAELAFANSVRVVTAGLKALLVDCSINEQKIHIIVNGTDIDLFRPLDQTTCRRTLNLRNNVNFLVFAGNLAPWQDLMTVFKAMPIILSRGYDVELLILGEGRERARFTDEVRRAKLHEKVHFLGELQPEIVNQYLNAADIGIAPFIRERNIQIGLSPLKVRDYAAAGLPIVSSDIPGLDTFKAEPWITLVEPENVDDFAEAIIEQLEGPRKQRSLAARAYAVKHFSWKDVVQHLKQLFG